MTPFKKTIAFFTLIIFSGQTLASAAPALSLSERMLAEYRLSPPDIQIPAEMGSVKDSFDNPSGAGLIIHIQNAHGNYQAQKQIEKLIRHLNKKYGIRCLFLEGANDKLDPSVVRFFNDNRLNLKVADILMRHGEFTGAERFLLAQPGKAEGFGMEDTELYRKDFDLFRKIIRGKEPALDFLKKLEKEITAQENLIFSKKLKKFAREWKKFKQPSAGLLGFIRILHQYGLRYLSMDLKDPRYQEQYGAVLRVLKLQDLEKRLDKAKIEEEKKALLEFLRGKVHEKLYNQLIHLETGKKEAGYVRYLFEKILEQASGKGLDFKNYPHVTLYAEYLIFKSEIDSEKLFEEAETLSEKIFEALAKIEDQKELVRTIHETELLKKLFSLELSRREYEKTLPNKEQLNPRSLVNRLTKLRVKTTAGSISHSEPSKAPEVPSRAEESLGTYETGSAQELFYDALKFYELAAEREKYFLVKTLETMRQKKESAAIVVTGGFHALGFQNLLKEKGISHLSVMPRIAHAEQGHDLYLRSMLGTTKIFQSSHIEKALRELPAASRIKLVGPELMALDQELGLEAVRYVVQRAASLGQKKPEVERKPGEAFVPHPGKGPLGRRDFMGLGAGVAIYLGAEFAQAAGGNGKAWSWDEMERLGKQSKLQQLHFNTKKDYTRGEAADILRLLFDYQAEFNKFVPQEGAQEKTADNAFEERRKKIETLQERYWNRLKKIVKNPALGKYLDKPYTPSAFLELLFLGIPPYMASYGLYTNQKQIMLTGGRAGEDLKVLFATVEPAFWEVEAIEKPDFGPELARQMEALGVRVTQRLIIGGKVGPDLKPVDIPAGSASRIWEGKNTYGVIAQNKNSIAEMLERLREVSANIKQAVKKPEDREKLFDWDLRLRQLETGADAAKLGRMLVLLKFVLEAENLSEAEQEENAKKVIDRHEAGHLLDAHDPEEKLVRATLGRLPPVFSEYQAVMFNLFVHAEINGILSELEHGPALPALAEFSQLLEGGAVQGDRLLTGESPHWIAAQWIYQKMIEFIEGSRRGGPERFGITVNKESRVSREDQIKLQLVKLADSDRGKEFVKLIQAIRKEHERNYAQKFSSGTQPGGSGIESRLPLIVTAGGLAAGAAGMVIFKIIQRRREAKSAAGHTPSAKPHKPKNKKEKKSLGREKGESLGQETQDIEAKVRAFEQQIAATPAGDLEKLSASVREYQDQIYQGWKAKGLAGGQNYLDRLDTILGDIGKRLKDAAEEEQIRKALLPAQAAIKTYGIDWLVRNAEYRWTPQGLFLADTRDPAQVPAGMDWSECGLAAKIAGSVGNLSGQIVSFGIPGTLHSQNQKSPWTTRHVVLVTDSGKVIDLTPWHHYLHGSETPYINLEAHPLSELIKTAMRERHQAGDVLRTGAIKPADLGIDFTYGGAGAAIPAAFKRIDDRHFLETSAGMAFGRDEQGRPVFVFYYLTTHNLYQSRQSWGQPVYEALQNDFWYFFVPADDLYRLQPEIKKLLAEKPESMRDYLKSHFKYERKIANKQSEFPETPDRMAEVEEENLQYFPLLINLMSKLPPLTASDRSRLLGASERAVTLGNSLGTETGQPGLADFLRAKITEEKKLIQTPEASPPLWALGNITAEDPAEKERQLKALSERPEIEAELDRLLNEKINHAPLRPDPGHKAEPAPHVRTLEEVERTGILRAIIKHKGNVRQAIAEIGFGSHAVYTKLDSYGVMGGEKAQMLGSVKAKLMDVIPDIEKLNGSYADAEKAEILWALWIHEGDIRKAVEALGMTPARGVSRGMGKKLTEWGLDPSAAGKTERIRKVREELPEILMAKKERWAAILNRETAQQLVDRTVLLRADFKNRPVDLDMLSYAVALYSTAAHNALLDSQINQQILSYVGGEPQGKQIEAALLLLFNRTTVRMLPSEGKTLTVGLAAFLKAIAGFKVEVHDWSKLLSARDAQVEGAILNQLDMRVAAMIGKIPYEFALKGETFPHLKPIQQGGGIHAIQRMFGEYDIVYGPYDQMIFLWMNDWVSVANHKIHATASPEAVIGEEGDTPLLDNLNKPLAFFKELYKLGDLPDLIYRLVYEYAYALIEEQRAGKNPYQVSSRKVSILKERREAVLRVLRTKLKSVAGALEFVDRLDLLDLLHAALEAQLIYQEKKQYLVRQKSPGGHKGKIVLINENTGEIHEDERLSRGLHTFLEIKHGLAIQKESSIELVMTAYEFYSRIRSFSAVMGYLGNGDEDRLKKLYDMDVKIMEPAHLNNRTDLESRYFLNEKEKFQYIAELAKQIYLETKRPVLINAQSPFGAEGIAQAVRELGFLASPDDLRVIDGQNEEDNARDWNRMGDAASITIAAQIASRGQEIKLDPALYENPVTVEINGQPVAVAGLFVIGSHHSKSERVEEQVKTRTARRGKPGVALIVEHLRVNRFLEEYAPDELAEFLANPRLDINSEENRKTVIPLLFELARIRHLRALSLEQAAVGPMFKDLVDAQFRYVSIARKLLEQGKAVPKKNFSTFVNAAYYAISRNNPGEFNAVLQDFNRRMIRLAQAASLGQGQTTEGQSLGQLGQATGGGLVKQALASSLGKAKALREIKLGDLFSVEGADRRLHMIDAAGDGKVERFAMNEQGEIFYTRYAASFDDLGKPVSKVEVPWKILTPGNAEDAAILNRPALKKIITWLKENPSRPLLLVETAPATGLNAIVFPDGDVIPVDYVGEQKMPLLTLGTILNAKTDRMFQGVKSIEEYLLVAEIFGKLKASSDYPQIWEKANREGRNGINPPDYTDIWDFVSEELARQSYQGERRDIVNRVIDGVKGHVFKAQPGQSLEAVVKKGFESLNDFEGLSVERDKETGYVWIGDETRKVRVNFRTVPDLKKDLGMIFEKGLEALENFDMESLNVYWLPQVSNNKKYPRFGLHLTYPGGGQYTPSLMSALASNSIHDFSVSYDLDPRDFAYAWIRGPNRMRRVSTASFFDADKGFRFVLSENKPQPARESFEPKNFAAALEEFINYNISSWHSKDTPGEQAAEEEKSSIRKLETILQALSVAVRHPGQTSVSPQQLDQFLTKALSTQTTLGFIHFSDLISRIIFDLVTQNASLIGPYVEFIARQESPEAVEYLSAVLLFLIQRGGKEPADAEMLLEKMYSKLLSFSQTQDSFKAIFLGELLFIRKEVRGENPSLSSEERHILLQGLKTSAGPESLSAQYFQTHPEEIEQIIHREGLDPKLEPAEVKTVRSDEAKMAEVFGKEPVLRSLLLNSSNAIKLIRSMTLLRKIYGVKEDEEVTGPPLEYALEYGLFFSVMPGSDIYLAPDMGSFKRHFIFKKDPSGRIEWVLQFKIPSNPEERPDNYLLDEQEFDIPDLLHRKHPDSLAEKSIAVLKLSDGWYDFYYQSEHAEFDSTIGTEFYIAISEYPFDGKRLASFKPEELPRDREAVARLIVREIARIHHAGYAGNDGSNRATDMHLANLRMRVEKDGNFQLSQLDFTGYRPLSGDPAVSENQIAYDFRTVFQGVPGVARVLGLSRLLDIPEDKLHEIYREEKTRLEAFPAAADSLGQENQLPAGLFPESEKRRIEYQTEVLARVYPKLGGEAKKILLDPQILLVLMGVKPFYKRLGPDDPDPMILFNALNESPEFKDSRLHLALNGEYFYSVTHVAIQLLQNQPFLEQLGFVDEHDQTDLRRLGKAFQEKDIQTIRQITHELLARLIDKLNPQLNTSKPAGLFGVLFGYPLDDTRAYMRVIDAGEDALASMHGTTEPSKYKNLSLFNAGTGTGERHIRRLEAAVDYAYSRFHGLPDFAEISQQYIAMSQGSSLGKEDDSMFARLADELATAKPVTILPVASDRVAREMVRQKIEEARAKHESVQCLTVCTANYHRSAALDWLLSAAAKREGLQDVRVSSGGTDPALTQQKLDNSAFRTASVQSLDSEPERVLLLEAQRNYGMPKPLTPAIVREATVIIAAGEEHKRFIEQNFPEAAGKTVLFTELAPEIFPDKQDIPDPGKEEIEEQKLFALLRRGVETDILPLFRAHETRDIFTGSGDKGILTISEITLPGTSQMGQIRGALRQRGKVQNPPFTLPLIHAPPSKEQLLQQLSTLLFSPSYTHFEVVAPAMAMLISRALAWFQDPHGFSGVLVVLSEHPQIKEIGQANIIGVSVQFKDDPIAWLHAIFQAAVEEGVIGEDEIPAALSPAGAQWYQSHLPDGEQGILLRRYTTLEIVKWIFSELHHRLTARGKGAEGLISDIKAELHEIQDLLLESMEDERKGLTITQDEIWEEAHNFMAFLHGQRRTRQDWYKANQIVLERKYWSIKGRQNEINRRIDHVEGAIHALHSQLNGKAQELIQQARRFLADVRFQIAMSAVERGNLSKAQYVLGQLRNSEGVDREFVPRLELAISDYQKFQEAREAIFQGDAGTAQRILNELKAKRAQANLIEQIASGVERLASLPAPSQVQPLTAEEIRRRIASSDRVQFIAEAKTAWVFKLEGYPHLVFKISLGGDGGASYEDEALKMSEVAHHAGYRLEPVDGLMLMKIKGFAPVAYLEGVIVEHLATARPALNAYKDYRTREGAIAAAMQFQADLSRQGIRWLDVKPDNLGEIGGEEVLIDNGFVSVQGSSLGSEEKTASSAKPAIGNFPKPVVPPVRPDLRRRIVVEYLHQAAAFGLLFGLLLGWETGSMVAVAQIFEYAIRYLIVDFFILKPRDFQTKHRAWKFAGIFLVGISLAGLWLGSSFFAPFFKAMIGAVLFRLLTHYKFKMVLDRKLHEIRMQGNFLSPRLLFYPLTILIYLLKNPQPLFTSLLGAWIAGLPFLMLYWAALFVHEMGHYLTAWFIKIRDPQQIKAIQFNLLHGYVRPFPFQAFSSSLKSDAAISIAGPLMSLGVSIVASSAVFFLSGAISESVYGFVALSFYFFVKNLFSIGSDGYHFAQALKGIQIVNEAREKYSKIIPGIDAIAVAPRPDTFIFLSGSSVYWVHREDSLAIDNEKTLKYFDRSTKRMPSYDLHGTLVKTDQEESGFQFKPFLQFKESFYAVYKISDFPPHLLEQPVPAQPIIEQHAKLAAGDKADPATIQRITDNILSINKAVRQGRHQTLYYPASGRDVVRVLLAYDVEHLLAVDTEDPKTEESLKRLGIKVKVSEQSRLGRLEKILRFNLAGKKRQITQIVGDARGVQVRNYLGSETADIVHIRRPTGADQDISAGELYAVQQALHPAEVVPVPADPDLTLPGIRWHLAQPVYDLVSPGGFIVLNEGTLAINYGIETDLSQKIELPQKLLEILKLKEFKIVPHVKTLGNEGVIYQKLEQIPQPALDSLLKVTKKLSELAYHVYELKGGALWAGYLVWRFSDYKEILSENLNDTHRFLLDAGVPPEEADSIVADLMSSATKEIVVFQEIVKSYLAKLDEAKAVPPAGGLNQETLYHLFDAALPTERSVRRSPFSALFNFAIKPQSLEDLENHPVFREIRVFASAQFSASSLGQPEQDASGGSVKPALADGPGKEGRNPEFILKVALPHDQGGITEGVLFIQDEETLRWAMKELGLLEPADQHFPEAFRAFSRGNLDQAIFQRLGVEESKSTEGGASLVLFPGVMTAGKRPDQEALAESFTNSLEAEDQVVLIRQGNSALLDALIRSAGRHGVRVRTVRDELVSASVVGEMIHDSQRPAIVISPLGEKRDLEINFKGRKFKFNDAELQGRIDKVKVIGLLRKIADYPDKFNQIGLISKDGYWEIGGAFANFIEKLYNETRGEQVSQVAA